MIPKTLVVDGHRVSIKLEKECWEALRWLAGETPLHRYIENILRHREKGEKLPTYLRRHALEHTITRAAEAEDRLRTLMHMNGPVELFLESLPLPVVIVDHGKTIRYHNPAFMEWLNLREPCIGRLLCSVLIVRPLNGSPTLDAVLRGNLSGACRICYISPTTHKKGEGVIQPAPSPQDKNGAAIYITTLLP